MNTPQAKSNGPVSATRLTFSSGQFVTGLAGVVTFVVTIVAGVFGMIQYIDSADDHVRADTMELFKEGSREVEVLRRQVDRGILPGAERRVDDLREELRRLERRMDRVERIDVSD